MADYNIVALGPPGSGKTVYLAALHHSITSGHLADGIEVGLDHTQELLLASIYREVADPAGAWPPGTSRSEPMREFEMRFSVRRTRQPLLFGQPRQLSYPAFTIKYVDYAGEWFTEGHLQDEALVRPFDELLNRADVLLCFVDGQRLLGLMRGRKQDGKLIEELGWAVNRCRALGAPVVIMVTKWDLLEGHVRLPEVATVLMNDRKTKLAGLVTERAGRRRLTGCKVGGIWVVPVSAIGPNFAWIASDGAVRKVGRGEPQPRNIAVPLTTGLIELSRLELDKYKRGARRGSGLRVEELVKSTAAASVDVTKLAAFSGELAASAVRLLSWPAAFAFYRMRRQARRFRARGVQGVSSAEGAVMYIAGALREQQCAFAAVPEYRFSKLWSDGSDWELQ